MVSLCDEFNLRKHGLKAQLQHRLLVFLGLAEATHSETIVGSPAAKEGLREGILQETGYLGVSTTVRFAAASPPVSPPRPLASTEPRPGASPSQSSFRQRQHQIKCICQVPSSNTAMVRCIYCLCLQHSVCMGRAPESKENNHHCELCRIILADPFWGVSESILPPSRLKPTVGRAQVFIGNSLHTHQSAERVFYLHAAMYERLKQSAGQVSIRLSCVLLQDAVPCRIHWPRHVSISLNGMPLRPYLRSTQVEMGINQRDQSLDISDKACSGRNVLTVQGTENGTWVLFLHWGKRRSSEQVKACMGVPETVLEAVERVKGSMCGGGGGDADEVHITHEVVSLNDPLTGTRMTKPARFCDGASGLQAFDLASFLSIVEKNRKWQDPTTLKNATIVQLRSDTYMQRIVDALKRFPGIENIEIDSAGQWRPEGFEVDFMSITESIESIEGILSQKPCGQPVSQGTSRVQLANPDADVDVDLADDEDETDAEEELRRAASTVKPVALNLPNKRAKLETGEEQVEIIDLLGESTDDETVQRVQHIRPNVMIPAGLRHAPSHSMAHIVQARNQAHVLNHQHRGVTLADVHPSVVAPVHAGNVRGRPDTLHLSSSSQHPSKRQNLQSQPTNHQR